MSWQASKWAAAQRVGSPSAKLVLLIIAEAAKEGECFLSHETIAERAELDRRSVIRHMAALEGAGLIKRTRRYNSQGHRTSDRVELLVSEVAENDPALSDNLSPELSDNLSPNPALSDSLSPELGDTVSPREAENSQNDTAYVTNNAGLSDSLSQYPVSNRLELERPARASRRKPETTIPASFPDATAIEAGERIAAKRGVILDLPREAERFRLHAEANDRRCRDWNAAWRMWVDKGADRAPKAKTVAMVTQTSDFDAWRGRLSRFKSTGYWTRVDWGPKPHEVGCRAPAELLSEFQLGAAA